MSGDRGEGLSARQGIRGDRDAFGVGRDLTINNYFGQSEHDPLVPAAGADREGAPRRRVWGGVPARNPGFIGRGLLADIQDALASADDGLVLALQGMGGVGKTQLATEYATCMRASTTSSGG